MMLPELTGLRLGGEALFTTGRAGTFGADDTGADSSRVGRRKKIPCSFHLVSPSVKINAVNDASSPSWHTSRAAVYLASASHRPGDRLDVDGSGGVRSCMVMHEVSRHRCPRRFARASWSPRPTRTRQRGGPRLPSPMQGPSRKQLSPPRRLLHAPVSRCVRSSARRCRRVVPSLSQADARALTTAYSSYYCA